MKVIKINLLIRALWIITEIVFSFECILFLSQKGANVVVQCNIVNRGISRYTSVPTSIGNTDTSLKSQEKTSHLPSGDMAQTTQHTENAGKWRLRLIE
jgi:hypothetical protein